MLSDGRFEGDLIRVVRDYAASEAPEALRARVAAVPEEAPASKRRRSISRVAGSIPRVITLAGLAAVLIASLWLRFGPDLGSQGASVGTAGTPLTIQTDPPASGQGCLQAGLMPVRMERSGSEIQFVFTSTGRPALIAWPNGFSGRLIDGQAELLAPNGVVVAAEGDVLASLGGAPVGDVFHVCQIGKNVY
jgi:hypothetical protein